MKIFYLWAHSDKRQFQRSCGAFRRETGRDKSFQGSFVKPSDPSFSDLQRVCCIKQDKGERGYKPAYIKQERREELFTTQKHCCDT